jgi:hypothetical protein
LLVVFCAFYLLVHVSICFVFLRVGFFAPGCSLRRHFVVNALFFLLFSVIFSFCRVLLLSLFAAAATAAVRAREASPLWVVAAGPLTHDARPLAAERRCRSFLLLAFASLSLSTAIFVHYLSLFPGAAWDVVGVAGRRQRQSCGGSVNLFLAIMIAGANWNLPENC